MAMQVISLFTGAGGLDLGLERAGMEVRVCVEIADYSRKTLEANRHKGYWKHCKKVFADINDVDPSDLLLAAGLGKREVFMVAGGPPCQSYSTAGKRLSIQDPRGGLFFKYVQVIEAIRPRFFLFENVRGILSAAIRHRPLSQRGPEYPPLEPDEELGSLLNKVILPTFRDRLGYEVVYGLLNAADYGVPQDRQRVIFVGSRDWELGSSAYLEQGKEMPITALFPPTHDKKGRFGLPKWLTLGSALAGLNDPSPEYIPYSKARASVFGLVPPGRNWRYLRDTYGKDFLKEVMGGAYSSSGGKVGFWRRLSFDKPCPTIVTSPIQKSTGMCHPEEVRPLSVRECARVQQFPDDYVFMGSIAQKYIQVGNAVPVGLAEYLGKVLLKVASRSKTEHQRPYLMPAAVNNYAWI